MPCEVQLPARLCAALKDFSSSLEAIQYSRRDPIGVARRIRESWRGVLLREITSTVCLGDAQSRCAESLCKSFLSLETGVIDVALAGFVEAVKVDLLAYKFEVYKVFMGIGGKEIHELADCGRILMSLWDTDGTGKEVLSRFPDHERLVGAHDLVRAASIEAVYCFRNGDADRAFDALGRMEAASTAIGTFLDGVVLKIDCGFPSVW